MDITRSKESFEVLKQWRRHDFLSEERGYRIFPDYIHSKIYKERILKVGKKFRVRQDQFFFARTKEHFRLRQDTIFTGFTTVNLLKRNFSIAESCLRRKKFMIPTKGLLYK